MNRGHLLVISGPSGTGKGTICREIIDRLENIAYSVSMTTRSPRKGEKDGQDYYFVDTDEFMKLKNDGGLLEFAKVYDNYYGTPQKAVLDQLEAGIDVILEIDVQGAMKVKESYPEGVFIFILPPSMSELRRRITTRATDSKEVIEKRMNKAFWEIEKAYEYDYYVVNDNIDDAVDNVESIITAVRSKTPGIINEIIDKYKEEM